MIRWPIRLALAAGMLLASGCYKLQPKAELTTFGSFDPARDKALAEQANTLEAAGPITVVAGTVPEGLSLVEEGSKLVVLEGYQDRYRVLGEARGDYSEALSKNFINTFYGAWKYEETPWRRGYCYPQVPLKVATLGIWALIPFHYPCTASLDRTEEGRQIALIEEMKKATQVMGGNLLIVTGGTTQTTLAVDRTTGRVVSSSNLPYVGMSGFAVAVLEPSAE